MAIDSGIRVDPLDDLTRALNLAIPGRDLDVRKVRQVLPHIEDLFDPCAVIDSAKFRKALNFDRLFTIKSWTIEMDDRLHDAAIRDMLIENVKRGWKWQTKVEAHTLWGALYNWEQMHPLEHRSAREHRRKVGTLRISSSLASGERILNELHDNVRFPATVDHLAAFVGKYFRRLQKNRCVTIVPTDAFDEEDRPKEQLVMQWNGFDTLKAWVLKRNDPQRPTLPYTEADLLIWGQKL